MKPWHKNYPENVEHEIDDKKYQSMVDLFNQTVERFQDKVAYANYGTELTFNELEVLSRDFAAYLQNVSGVKKGDRIGLMCPNGLQFVVATWGIIRTGAILVNVNPYYTPRELKHQLNNAEMETIVIHAGSTSVLAEVIDESPIKNVLAIKPDDIVNKGLPDSVIDPRINPDAMFTQALKEGKDLQYTEPTIVPSDLFFLQYTGGTTGLSKGVMLSNNNMVANIVQFNEFTKNILIGEDEIVLTAIPMYHILALAVNTLCYFEMGAQNVLITDATNLANILDTFTSSKVTSFVSVNSMFNALVHCDGFDDVDFSTMHFAIGGGAPVQEAVSQKWAKVTGQRIYEGYGLSETAPVLCLNIGKDDVYVPGVGIPLSSTDIIIRDLDDNIVKQGELGEVCAKGPQVMQGYWNNPKVTAEVMTDDGYFLTDDIGYMDEFGYFHLVDRKKEMILVSGLCVYPNEIEGNLAKMAGLLETACVGRKDPDTGEVTKIYAVKTDPSITAEDVIAFCCDCLESHKVPKEVVFMDALPKTSVGKILRRELTD
ncbi:MAG: long-chain-fatty-acid--CoA ligase [Gammaproteobacteria bacterium]|nr:MAG: long-chain-fatty-acid--CoA ligase [Gammaproteobacteria bacterium]